MKKLTQKEIKNFKNELEKNALKRIEESKFNNISTVEEATKILNTYSIKCLRALKKSTNLTDLVNFKIKNYYLDKLNTVYSNIDALFNDSTIESLNSIECVVEWAKNPTWGCNPTVRAWVNGEYVGTGHASGCGYDKRSAAINTALRDSKVFKKHYLTAIIKGCTEYGVRGADIFYKLGCIFDFGGCGVEVLRNFLEKSTNTTYRNFTWRSTKATDYIFWSKNEQ